MHLLKLAALACLAGLVACGSPRHVVIHPDEVAGRQGDTWKISGEPQSTVAADAAAVP
jgi:hypothetical protein